MKVKGVNISSLNNRQINAMKRHSKHHTAKHLKEMVYLMNRGKNFTESHRIAIRKVGK